MKRRGDNWMCNDCMSSIFCRSLRLSYEQPNKERLLVRKYTENWIENFSEGIFQFAKKNYKNANL